jgi:hypothetical protein
MNLGDLPGDLIADGEKAICLELAWLVSSWEGSSFMGIKIGGGWIIDFLLRNDKGGWGTAEFFGLLELLLLEDSAIECSSSLNGWILVSDLWASNDSNTENINYVSENGDLWALHGVLVILWLKMKCLVRWEIWKYPLSKYVLRQLRDFWFAFLSGTFAFELRCYILLQETIC